MGSMSSACSGFALDQRLSFKAGRRNRPVRAPQSAEPARNGHGMALLARLPELLALANVSVRIVSKAPRIVSTC